MSDTTDAKTAATDFLAALDDGDADRLREILAEDATWTMMAPSLGMPPFEGAEAIIGFFAGRPSPFEGGKGPVRTITRIVAEGDGVAIEATGKARFLDGRVYDNRYHFAIDTKDGRVTAIRHYQDSHHIANLMAQSEGS